MTRHLGIVVLALALSVPSTIMATDPDQEATSDITPIGGLTFLDEIELTVVNVIAYVTDKGGHPITDLKKDDFRLLHDGKVREISNFKL